MGSFKSVDNIYSDIKNILENARKSIVRSVNSTMVAAYWNIGKIIVEEEQKGRNRANYGEFLLSGISQRLTRDFGRGFDESNLRYFRLFYMRFSNCDALRHDLSWTHYRLLLKLESEISRNFYINETANNNWSTRELESGTVR